MNIGQFSDSFMPIVDGVGRVVFNYASYIGKKIFTAHHVSKRFI